MSVGEGRIQLGIFDRLIDNAPENRSEVPLTRPQALRVLRTSLRRDLEWLLNSIRPLDLIPDGARELPRSLLNFGLPDFTNMTLHSAHDEQRLLRSIETAIQTFEPRLTQVRVTPRGKITKQARTINFQIEAMLMVDPAPERILFDTVLEVARGTYQVKGDGS